MVETVVYLAIFGVIFVGMMQFFFLIAQSNKAVEDQVLLEKNILLITQHSNMEFLDAYSIDEAASVFDDDNGVLVLNLDEAETEKVKYEIVNLGIQFEDENTDLSKLSRTVVDVNRMKYEIIQNSDNDTVGVRVEYRFFIDSSNVTRNFETSYLLNKQL